MGLIPKETLDKMAGCFALLPTPGDEVARQLYAHIKALEYELIKSYEECEAWAETQHLAEEHISYLEDGLRGIVHISPEQVVKFTSKEGVKYERPAYSAKAEDLLEGRDL